MSTNAKRILAFLFLSQALFVSSTFRTWVPVCVFTVSMLVLTYFRQRRIRENAGRPRGLPRWLRGTGMFVVMLGLVGTVAGWRIGVQTGESLNPIFVGMDVLAHACLFGSLVVWLVRPNHGHVAMLALGLVVVLLCVAAGGTSLSLAAQTTVALAACVGFALASQIIMSAQRDRAARQNSSSANPSSADQGSAWLSPLFSLMTLSILMMATSAIANATNLVLPSLQDRLREQLQASLDAVADESYIGGTRYVQGSRIGTIRQHMLADPQEVALQIHSEIAPGYLRGHVFDIYRSRRWIGAGDDRGGSTLAPSLRDRSLPPAGMGTTKLHSGIDLKLKRFRLTDQRDATVNIEIHNDPLKGPMVFLPLTSRWVEAYSGELVVSHQGVVRLGVDVTRPYVAGVGLRPLRESLDQTRRDVLTELPPWMEPQLQSIADQVCADAATTRSKANAISQFFQSGFGYTMTRTKAPRGIDPLSYFLETRHDAHCEYFASSTVLLLRAAGVPTRYVTGYVSDEFDAEKKSWVARNRDAHAWAEAYDDSSRQWFAVESTPGRTYHTIDPTSESQASDSFFDVFSSDDGDDNDSVFGRLVGWLFAFRATDPLLLLFRFAQLPLFCVLVFLLWSKYLRPSRDQLDAGDQLSRRLLRKADRRLKKYSLVRLPSETIYKFADRIDAYGAKQQTELRPEQLQQMSLLSNWYRQYADARYQGQTPIPLT